MVPGPAEIRRYSKVAQQRLEDALILLLCFFFSVLTKPSFHFILGNLISMLGSNPHLSHLCLN